MPLFGHKNKDRSHHATGTGSNATDPALGSQDYGNTGNNYDNNSGFSNPNTAHTGSTDPNNYGAGEQTGMNTAAGSGAPGTGMGMGTGTGTGHGHHHQHGQHGMVGSAALREQAMLRDREAQNFQAQSQELAEAERLEQQAREHRERAVAQGAHPMNKHLAGGNLGQGGQTGQPGAGQTRGTNY